MCDSVIPPKTTGGKSVGSRKSVLWNSLLHFLCCLAFGQTLHWFLPLPHSWTLAVSGTFIFSFDSVKVVWKDPRLVSFIHIVICVTLLIFIYYRDVVCASSIFFFKIDSLLLDYVGLDGLKSKFGSVDVTWCRHQFG